MNRKMKQICIYVFSRIVKLFANCSKMLCYFLYFFFPSKRFIIPYSSRAILKGKNKFISNILWQTNFTNKVTLPVYLNYLCNRLMAPTFEFRFMSDTQMSEFIKLNHSSEIYETYSRLQIGAARADLWRVLVLKTFGGVYLDIDAHLVWPIEFILDSNDHEMFIRTKNGEFSNYFIASKIANPRLDLIINQIIFNIKINQIKGVFDLTGPGVLNKLLNISEVKSIYYQYCCLQGNFTNDFFQYIDKPGSKWTQAQKTIDIVRK